MGFESGVYVAYLTGRRLIAMNAALPELVKADELTAAVKRKEADAVLVWGRHSNPSYQPIVDQLRQSPTEFLDQAITDPALGEVGRIVFFSRQ